MVLNTKKIHAWLRWLTLLILFAFAYDGYQLWRAAQINKAIADGSIMNAQSGLPPPALFAQAYLLTQKGAQDDAVATYKRVESSAVAELDLAAKYNRANRYLAQAMELDEQTAKQVGLPLVEMAKDTYRAVLRVAPDHWDAKYNLERALRLAPDPDDSDDADLPPPEKSERALTTMHGFSLGLP
jgi:mxaK protein